ncbi:MAG: 4Fe-4S dicluster domain-containing protein, partial [Flavobacteriales bacterium]|nr:4Fe-4S dicluster domain-containing protein [Flavobacteriales bacterium]
ANTFLAYIIGVDELKKIATEPLSQHVGGFVAMIVFSTIFFFVYTWFREQVCLVVCPYGRMQSVLLDKHSIVVAYDHVRGEPREKFSKEQKHDRGDCIDCFECVRVCPTGIDIRNGTQLECVNCTACIDACDHMMDSVHRPKGLIRYASEHNIATGKPTRWTPRMIAYTGLLFVLIGLESFLLLTRSDLDVAVVRAKGTLFYREDGGMISNLYNVKIINKTRHDMPVQVQLTGDKGKVRWVGEPNPVVKADSLIDTQFFIMRAASDLTDQQSNVNIQVLSNGEIITTEKTSFIGPLSSQ